MAMRASRSRTPASQWKIRATPAVVEIEAPSGSFDWGDAGIGAAGMLALFSITGGALLLATSRRRRRVSIAH
jgi:hypothetical protein